MRTQKTQLRACPTTHLRAKPMLASRKATNDSSRDFPAKEVKSFLQPKSSEGLVKNTPSSFKIGRDYAMQSIDVENDLFNAILHPETLEGTGTTISPLPASISEYGLTAYVMAAQQLLYNQSVKSSNEDVNSGCMRQRATKDQFPEQDAYAGNIFVSLNELCRKAYGVKNPTTDQRAQMASLIKAVDSYFVTLKYPKGRSRFLKLIACMGKYVCKEDGSINYHLVLNPIFCGPRIMSNFGEFPQDLTLRLRAGVETVSKRMGHKRHAEMTATILRLVQRLGMQDKRKPCKWALNNLLAYLSLEGEYKNTKKRVLGKLALYFDVLKEIGLLTTKRKYNPERCISSDGEESLIFHLNPKFREPLASLSDSSSQPSTLQP